MTDDPLRIAMVAPPFYQIPPQAYGGIEAVVAQLADGLVDRGHEVTLHRCPRIAHQGTLVTTFDEPQGSGSVARSPSCCMQPVFRASR